VQGDDTEDEDQRQNQDDDGVNLEAGRLIGVPVLRQFGLVENEKVDSFLATVFSKCPEATVRL